MKTDDLALTALAGLNDRSDAPVDAVVEKADDETIPRNTASTATDLVVVTANDSVEKKSKRGRKRKENYTFPVEPRVVQVVKKPRTYINHSYRDFSSVPAEMNYEAPEKISDMTFSQRMHHILSQEEYKKWIGWHPHGRAFKILVPKKLEQGQILQKYFGHGRYSSFLRQLSKHGFKHISNGPDRNSYYHECFIRGLPHLIEYMPGSKDARRLIPDTENELDFYAVSRKYPLPDDPSFDTASPYEESERSTKSQHVPSPDLASEASWCKDKMPPARRAAFMSNTYALKGVETDPAPRVNTMAASGATIAPAPFGSTIISQIEDLVNSAAGAPKATPRINYLHDIMGYIAATGATAAAPSSANKAPVPVANVAPFAHRQHFGAPELSTDALSHLQEVIRRNSRSNQFMAVAALNANIGGLQQQAQVQNPAGNLGHILAGLQHSQPQLPLVQQGGVQTHSELQSQLLAAFLRSTAAPPSYAPKT